MNPRYVGVLLVFLVLPARAERVRADMAMPGTKRISHGVCFDNLPDSPEFVFFLSPTLLVEPADGTTQRMGDYPVRVGSGVVHHLGRAVRFGWDWTLVAVPRVQLDDSPEPVSRKLLSADTPGVLHSNSFRFPDYDSVLIIYPKDFDVHHFQVDMTDGKLTATRTRIEDVSFQVGSFRVPLWPINLLICGAIAWLGIWWFRRPRRLPKKDATVSN
jgi:hypothetical protein